MARQRITWLTAAVILLLPAYALRFSLGPLHTNLLDVILLAATVWGIVEARQQNRSFQRPPFFWAALVLLLAAALSIPLAANHAAALGVFKSWFFLPIALAIVLAQFEWKEEEKNTVLYSLVAAGTFAAVWAIARFYFTDSWIDWQGVERAVGFFTQPNYLAMYLIAPAVVSTGLLVKAKAPSSRAIFAVTTVLLVLALFLSYSRAGLLAYGFTLLLGALVLYGWRVALACTAAVVILAGVAYTTVPSIKTRFATVFDTKSQNTSRTRVEIDHATFAMLKDHPVTGIGLGSYEDAYAHYRLPDALEQDVLHPHNIFFAFWTQTGILGLFAFLVLCLQLIAGKTWRNGQASTLMLLVIAATLAFGLFDTPYWKNDLSLLFWIPLLIASV